MPDTPLNPDALEAGHEAYRRAYFKDGAPAPRCFEKGLSAYLAAALPEVTSVEELDQLPIGSAVLSEKYIAQQEAEEYPCVFQKLYTGDWHRGGRSSDTHPDYFLPARVLYRPEVNDA